MKLKFYNTPQLQVFDKSILPGELPAFLSYEPDWLRLEEVVRKYSKYKNFVIIAHGGSITGFYGLYNSLKSSLRDNCFFLNTTDPDYIEELKAELKPQDTLIIAISKSGETTTQLEAVLQFTDYPMVFVTGENSPLFLLAEKLQAEIFIHPTIGGRYTGFTEVMLLPAMLCGFDARDFFEGGREMHKQFLESNLAYEAASVIWQLEQRGFVDIFMPFYSHGLYGFSYVIVQLCHESFGKGGKGGTYLAFEAPESQHHTNQRFFGGIKNMAGFFIGLEKFGSSMITKVPADLNDIVFKDATIGVLDNIPLVESMRFEMEGTLEDAVGKGIPLIEMKLADSSAKELGGFLAFWQLYAVYASLLRNVNPFDQPQVEASKVLSFEKRKIYSK